MQTAESYTGVIIDGAVPRTPYERCVTLFDYLVSISMVGPHSSLDPAVVRELTGPPVSNEYWGELENEIINSIQAQLPEQYVCVVGEQQPGDVIVRAT